METVVEQRSIWELFVDGTAEGFVEPDYTPEMTIEERFNAFHAANPQVYIRLRDLALMLRARGIQRYGIAALYEVLRFDHALRTVGADPFKLNNDYRALYARLLMERELGLEGFFEIRERKAR